MELKEHPVVVYPGKCTGCRICQLRCSFQYTDTFNPLNSYIIINRDHGVRTTSIEFTDECTWCGDCAEFCAYRALGLRGKET